ncbi:MAG: methionine--tRNA ligase [Verrucomicrobiota bacterium]|nr:methionine--tRNA ligase [Verrucomicrobiota bacterium]
MRETILITSALPYANGELHFGHIAGAYLPADCYARYKRLMGADVLYLCGSDEYGIAIALSAELAGRTPKQQVDLFHEINQKLFAKFGIAFDHYSRTTWPGHIPIVQEFFRELQTKGFIEERTEPHLYSEQEKRFLADRYCVGTCPKCGFTEARGDECPKCAASFEATDLKNPRSKMSGAPLTLRPSTHLYLRFDLFREKLSEWLTKKNWKENVLHLAMSYVQDLKARAITRDSEWGVPVPGMPDKVFYVWFDAPIGYVSAAQEWAEKTGDKERWKHYWLNPDAKLIHFIGKDNIPFHTLFFPAMLMGQSEPYKLPDEVPANEFLLFEGRKFSKSDHWTVDLESFFAKYSADQARYVLAANAPETGDADFGWRDFLLRCNGELLGKLGNFVHRVLTFAKTHCASRVPVQGVLEEKDRQFLQTIDTLTEAISLAYSSFHLRRAAQLVMEMAQTGNVYFDEKKPWIAAKRMRMLAETAGEALTEESVDASSLKTTIALSLFAICRLSLVASPILPASAQKIWEMLGFSTSIAQENWLAVCQNSLPIGQVLLEPTPLFRKIEPEEIEEEVSKLGSESRPT